MPKQTYSVSELNAYIKNCLDNNPELIDICVVGEISNYKLYPSGHHYFSLKDSSGSIKCVMFKGNAYSLRFRPENGMLVMAAGRVSVYERDGVYQLLVSAMVPAGSGELQLEFEKLKKRLDSEGLFACEHKKDLPVFPKKIAVITSPAGAAVQDIIRILSQRWPLTEVLVVPVKVQGDEASEEISQAIEFVNQFDLADLIITGRGGGSLEDLWAFNEEKLARAIFASNIPVISAVGHEPDVTISDYVADARASTPSNAAEIAVPNRNEYFSYINSYSGRLMLAMEKKLEVLSSRFKELSSKRVLKDPAEYLNMKRIRLDMLSSSIVSVADSIIYPRKQRFCSLAAKLDALSPLKVLSRGYSITLDDESNPISSINQLAVGDSIRMIFNEGHAEAEITKLIEGK